MLKIISGGQTGADRGALDAAIKLGIQHGGHCPKGRLAEDGTIPVKYNLIESSTKNYLQRTEINVVNSDTTFIFIEKMSRGSKRTIDFCNKHNKPFVIINIKEPLPTLQLKGIINIAGTRESKSKGIQKLVENFIINNI